MHSKCSCPIVTVYALPGQLREEQLQQVADVLNAQVTLMHDPALMRTRWGAHRRDCPVIAHATGIRFADVDPGCVFEYGERTFVKIDHSCEFAEHLETKWYAVEIGTGVIMFLGPDNVVQPKAMDKCDRD